MVSYDAESYAKDCDSIVLILIIVEDGLVQLLKTHFV